MLNRILCKESIHIPIVNHCNGNKFRIFLILYFYIINTCDSLSCSLVNKKEGTSVNSDYLIIDSYPPSKSKRFLNPFFESFSQAIALLPPPAQ